MRTIAVIVGIVLSASIAEAGTAGEVVANGFVFAGTQGAKLRESTSVDSKVLATAPAGTRLAYRRFYEVGGERTWYFVTFPGKPPAWVQAAQVGTKRPTVPPVGKPIQVKDSGLGEVKITASMTAAARGLDSRARSYAEKQDMKTTVDEFVALENEVGELFNDMPDANGEYDDQKEHVARKNAARVFKGGLR